MKLTPDPTRPPYEVDIEFMIGDADGYQHEVVLMNSLEEVMELAREIKRYFEETSWNQRCSPEPYKLLETYPMFAKYLTSNRNEIPSEQLSIDKLKNGWGEVYWPMDYNYAYYLHMTDYECYQNTGTNRYKIIFEEGDL